jgi:hypothetical protein
MRGFGKPRLEREVRGRFSHDSHRRGKKACGKRMVYVKSASKAAPGEGLADTGDAQRGYFRTFWFWVRGSD